jgi:hypothetical protein
LLAGRASGQDWGGEPVQIERDTIVGVIKTKDDVTAVKLRASLREVREKLRARGIEVLESNATLYLWGKPQAGKGGRLHLPPTGDYVTVVFFGADKRPKLHGGAESPEELLLRVDRYFGEQAKMPE